MFKKLVEIDEKIESLKAKLSQDQNDKNCRKILRDYLRMLMVRYAVKTHKNLTGNLDIEKAYQIADEHMNACPPASSSGPPNPSSWTSRSTTFAPPLRACQAGRE